MITLEKRIKDMEAKHPILNVHGAARYIGKRTKSGLLMKCIMRGECLGTFWVGLDSEDNYTTPIKEIIEGKFIEVTDEEDLRSLTFFFNRGVSQ